MSAIFDDGIRVTAALSVEKTCFELAAGELVVEEGVAD